MQLKYKLTITFISAFVIIFAALNSLFIVANFKYWFNESAASTQEVPVAEAHMFPVSGDKVAVSAGTTNHIVTSTPIQSEAVLVIDKIGVRAPIVFSTSSNDQVIYKELESGVVNYIDTPKPGDSGVSVILGHSSAYPWYKGKYGSVFALLGHLKVGDTFYVDYASGRRINYVVKQSFVFKPLVNDIRLNQIQNSTQPTLVLISCWPIGTNYQRIAVQAEQVN